MATAVGSIASIGGEATDSLKSRTFCTELKRLAEERDRSAQELSAKSVRFDKFLGDFLNREEFNRHLNDNIFDDNNGFVSFVTLLAKGSRIAYNLGNNSAKMIDSIKELKTLNVANNISRVKSNANLAKSLGKTAVGLAPTEVKGFKRI